MSRLFSECHYLFCYAFGVAFSCTDTCWICDRRYNLKALLYSSVSDFSDKCSFKCKCVETAFPIFNFWWYHLCRSHFKHNVFHIRHGWLNRFFLAYNDVTPKIEWPPKHLGAICTTQRLFGKWLLFICVMTKCMDFKFTFSTVAFTTLAALEFFSAWIERCWDRFPSSWMTCYMIHFGCRLHRCLPCLFPLKNEVAPSNNLTYSPRWVHSIWGVVGVFRKCFRILLHHQRKGVIGAYALPSVPGRWRGAFIYLHHHHHHAHHCLVCQWLLKWDIFFFHCISHGFLRFMIIVFLQLSLGFQYFRWIGSWRGLVCSSIFSCNSMRCFSLKFERTRL